METNIVGSRIAEARKKINLSQAQLAGHLFISPQAVGKWERGESLPDILSLTRLAEILGVDLNYFSENFPSTLAEKTSTHLMEQAAGLPSAKPVKKLTWNMSSGNWADADFSGLKNLHEQFSSSNLLRCKFIGSDLSGLLLKGNNVERCDFRGSDLTASQIQRSNLENNQFNDCLLKQAELSGSNIGNCDFSGADFTGATIKSTNFGKNEMTNVILNHTSFIGSNLEDTVFNGMIENCSFENCTFYRATFQNATLINTFFKNNSRMKRIKFIDCKADSLTYAFLKNGNADLSGITLKE